MIDLSFFKLNVFHSFVYKLTDFGAARELEAHEGFMSVYGTEEYLVGQILLAFFFNKYNTFKHTVPICLAPWNYLCRDPMSGHFAMNR